MKRRRILIVTPFPLGDVGGVSSAVAALRDELAAAGMDVTFFLPADSDGVTELGAERGSPAFGMYLRSPVVAEAPVKNRLAFWAFMPFTLLSIRRFLARSGIDVVIVQYPLPSMVYFGLLRRSASWKLIVTYQGNDAHDLHGWPRLERSAVRALVGAADAIVTVSTSLAEKVFAVFPRFRTKYHEVIPNGAFPCAAGDAAGIAGLPGDYVVTIGHLIHRKGVDTVIDALQLAAERGTRMRLVVVGEGPERDALQRRADTAGLGADVTFVGNRRPADVAALLRGSLCFVLASRAEGLPLVVAEAMACGKPVVATRIDGIPDIVADGETGLLVPPDDPRSLADALTALAGDSDLRGRMGAAGLARYRHGFTWQSVARRYVELFERVGA
jgi:glycosyltransferase involved in cell wall biosynthesis